jgi:hypothetical protein
MAPDIRVGGLLYWKFVAVEGEYAMILWKWEAWTQGGQLVASSGTRFDSLVECEKDAQRWGYVPPESRLR